MLSVLVTYQGPAGVPMIVTRLDDTESIRQVVDRAVSIVESRAAALESVDPQMAEMERLEAMRLRLALNALLPPVPTPTSSAEEPISTALQ